MHIPPTNGSAVSDHVAPSVSQDQNFHQWSSAILRIYEFLHNFIKVLYQLLKTVLSNRTKIVCNQLLKFLPFLPPFIFLNSPFKVSALVDNPASGVLYTYIPCIMLNSHPVGIGNFSGSSHSSVQICWNKIK